MIDWKPEAISAAWRAFNESSDNPMRSALNAAVEKNGIEELDTDGFFEAGYSQAIDDVAGLVENWQIPSKSVVGKMYADERKEEIVNAIRKMKANG
jgi:hypothetical protein